MSYLKNTPITDNHTCILTTDDRLLRDSLMDDIVVEYPNIEFTGTITQGIGGLKFLVYILNNTVQTQTLTPVLFQYVRTYVQAYKAGAKSIKDIGSTFKISKLEEELKEAEECAKIIDTDIVEFNDKN